MQRALIQYRNPELYDLVYEALQKAGRRDLIGYGPKCLIRPRRDDNVRGRTDLGNRGKKKEDRSGNGGTKRPKKKKTIRNVHRKK